MTQMIFFQAGKFDTREELANKLEYRIVDLCRDFCKASCPSIETHLSLMTSFEDNFLAELTSHHAEDISKGVCSLCKLVARNKM